MEIGYLKPTPFTFMFSLKSLVPELKVKYNQLFGTIDQMVPASKILSKVIDQKEEFLQILTVQ